MAGDRPPLDAAALRDLALRYVGRYATSEAKLRRYLGAQAVRARLGRRRRGTGRRDRRPARRPRLCRRPGLRRGARRGLTGRGFGARRVGRRPRRGRHRARSRRARSRHRRRCRCRRAVALPGGGASARSTPALPDPDRRRKQVAAMLRAGHDMATVRAVLNRTQRGRRMKRLVAGCGDAARRAAGGRGARRRSSPTRRPTPPIRRAWRCCISPAAAWRSTASPIWPAGAGRRPTVVLLHGLPGNEKNLDLAQAIRRAGWNVVTFNYRGSWGSPGCSASARTWTTPTRCWPMCATRPTPARSASTRSAW